METISRISPIRRIRMVILISTGALLVTGTLGPSSDGPQLLAISKYYWLGIFLLGAVAAGHVIGKLSGQKDNWPVWWSEVAIWAALVCFSILYAFTGDRMAWMNVVAWLFFWAMSRLRAVRRTARAG